MDALVEYEHPIFIYIPKHGELRGGAWVVIDPAINPEPWAWTQGGGGHKSVARQRTHKDIYRCIYTYMFVFMYICTSRFRWASVEQASMAWVLEARL